MSSCDDDESSGTEPVEDPVPIQKNKGGYVVNLDLDDEDDDGFYNLEEHEKIATHMGQMDLRVGRIIDVYPHDEDDSVYIEEVDLGTYDASRLLATTLVEDYPNLKDLEKRKVVVLCNVHPFEMRSIGSKSGNLLLAYKDFSEKGNARRTHELLEVTEGEPGARVYVEGFPNKPYKPAEQFLYESLVREMKVNDEGIVFFKDLPLKVEGTQGQVYAKTFTNCGVLLD